MSWPMWITVASSPWNRDEPEANQVARKFITTKVARPVWARLLVADSQWGTGAVQRKDVQLPLDRHRAGKVARLGVAGLVGQFPRDSDSFSVRAQGAEERRARVHLYILADAEAAFKDGHTLLDSGQIENFGLRIAHRLEFEV